MNKKFLILLFILTTPLFTFLKENQKYVVINNNVAFYENFADETKKGSISYGVALKSISQKGIRVQFIYNNQKIWINQKDLLPLEVDEKDFADASLLYMDTPIDNNNNMWFSYRNVLYKMNLDTPQNPNISLKTKLPKLSDFSFSEDRSQLLLMGDKTINGKHFLNLALFRLSDNTFTPLTFYYDNAATLNSSSFSQDNVFVAIFFRVEDENYLHLYDTETGEFIASLDGILGFNWIDSDLLIYTSSQIKLFSLKDQQLEENQILYRYPINADNSPSISIVDNTILFNINDTVYALSNNKLEKKDYRSIDRSKSGSLQQYTRKNTIYTTYNGDIIRPMTGTTPPWTLISIINDDLLLYRKQVDAFPIINLYNAIENKSYPFYWIEEPTYSLSNGISIESVVDKEEVWIFIEDPSDSWVKLVKLHEILTDT